MYIWTAIDVDHQLENIKALAQITEKDLKFENSAFTLPSHISLKISFRVDDAMYPLVEKTIFEYYQTVKPFEIEVSGIEFENTIVWIRMKENETLKQIHDDLDKILFEKHGIARHAYDLDFKFHTTLFLDPDQKKIQTAYNRIKDIEIPSFLHPRNLIIGTSESGAVGTYHVTYRMKIH